MSNRDPRFSHWRRCKYWSSGLLRHVDLRVDTKVSEEHTAFIFGAEMSSFCSMSSFSSIDAAHNLWQQSS
jgi:hypothetical protein